MKTTQITLRNVDDQLKRQINRGAKRQNKSINRFVLDVVRDSLGSATREVRLSRFFGKLPKDAFEPTAFADFEAIDESMWQ